MSEVPDLVAAYWQHHALAQGNREERLAAAGLFWAVEAVAEAVQSDEPLSILDALIASPEADLCFLGAGPVEDLLVERSGVWASSLADRCRQSARWRTVMSCVWLDNRERQHAEALIPYLRPYG